MASFVNIVPSIGNGVRDTQTSPNSAGYDAVDDRRKSHPFASEGILAAGAYRVSQRAAGANLSVDIAANVAAANGAAALVKGTSVTGQGLYAIPAHTAVVNVDITPANVTNPRNDLVILEVLDDAHDVGGIQRCPGPRRHRHAECERGAHERARRQRHAHAARVVAVAGGRQRPSVRHHDRGRTDRRPPPARSAEHRRRRERHRDRGGPLERNGRAAHHTRPGARHRHADQRPAPHRLPGALEEQQRFAGGGRAST